MTFKSRFSIQQLLRIWILGFTFVAVVLSSLFLIKYADDEINRSLQVTEGLIQLYSDDTVSIEYGRKNIVYVRDSLRRINQLLKSENARVRSNDGTIIESTDASEIGSPPANIKPNFKVLTAVVREHSSRETLGTLEVVINKNKLVAGALRRAFFPALIFFIGLLILSFLMIQFFQKRLIRPIQQLLSPKEIPESESALWPTEIDDLSDRLQIALIERDLSMVGLLTGGVIHDIKTRLHTINSATEMVTEQSSDSPKRLARLEGVYRACVAHIPKMCALIEATLDGSREIPINPKSGDIRETLQGVLSQYQEYADKRGVNLELKGAENFLIASHDAVQLERALGNIVKNGIEAFDGAGSREKRLRLTARQDQKCISIGIEDSGPGFAVAPKILLSSMRTTKVHGSGFGLLISRKIIEGHRGRLTAGTSKELKGAEFTITIPVIGGIA